LPTYSTFCFPDRLGNGEPFHQDTASTFPTLEVLGIEDWDRQIINSLIPIDRSLAIVALASTWARTKLSRWHREGRLALAEGLRWKNEPGGWVFATVPADLSAGRQTVLEFIGYDTEWYPEFVFVSQAGTQSWNEKHLIQWSQHQDLWSDPCYLIPHYAERIFAFRGSWIYLAVAPEVSPTIMNSVEALAYRWQLPLIEGPPEWQWL
jgi:hypothetical protein